MNHDFTNRYNTPIPPDRQKEYESWIAEDPKREKDKYDYDVNGFFLSGEGKSANGHATDEFKKPNHPTFSDQSIYNGVDGFNGGHWDEENGKYKASFTNVAFHGPNGLSNYFNNREKDIQLELPQVGQPDFSSDFSAQPQLREQDQ